MEDMTPKAKELLDTVPKEVFDELFDDKESSKDSETELEKFIALVERKMLQDFSEENCKNCGSQRCLGVFDKDWREGCGLYKQKFGLI